MRKKLAEDFSLPTPEAINAAIESIDEMSHQEGFTIRLVLGRQNFLHDENRVYHFNVLRPLVNKALRLEDVDSADRLRDRNHTLANAVLSGMIFGHMVNELTYPNFERYFDAYSPIQISPKLMTPAQMIEYTSLDAWKTPAGLRLAYYAMAQNHLDVLSTQSMQSLGNWSRELIPMEVNRSHFVSGFGLSLYAAWDEYSDQLEDEGRESEVVYPGAYVDHNRGDGTSI